MREIRAPNAVWPVPHSPLLTPYSHSNMIGFGKPLFGLGALIPAPNFYRQNYRHFDKHPPPRRSPSIDIYREQSALPQWPAFEMYRDLSLLFMRIFECRSHSLVRHGTQTYAGIKCLNVLSHRIFATIFLPSRCCRTVPANQCTSTVCSAVSFHGLIFASAFARFAFATSVS